MNEAVFRQKIGQMLTEVKRQPPAPPKPDTEAAPKHHGGMKQEMATLEESLDHLRLAIKYIMFDLEATKRENEILKHLLEDGPTQ